jgi:lysophospholipase L1-like esterase
MVPWRSLIGLALVLGCSSRSVEPSAPTGASGALTSSGVCGFTAPVAYGPPAADGMVDVPPNDPNIFYMGRVDCRPEGPTFAFPAVSVRLRFRGSALDLRLIDSGTGTATTTNYYDVSVDGGAPTRLEAAAGDHTYPLARDLGDGEHTAEIVKRVESNGNSGKGQLLGFRVREGTRLLPVRPRPLRVEFVGDSITCGYGNEASTTTPEGLHYTTINANANAAYGAVAARLLDAEYVAVAISGRGVHRNYGDQAGELAAAFYDDTLPDDPAAPPWDFTRYRPDVVVVNLGTNDFSPPGPDRDAYKRAYGSFLKQIRRHHPDALLLAVVGPMLSDSYPAGALAWTAIQRDVSGVVDELAKQGDTNVHYLALTPQRAPYGEDYHPTRATHRQMAQAVVTEVNRLLGRRQRRRWWPRTLPRLNARLSVAVSRSSEVVDAEQVNAQQQGDGERQHHVHLVAGEVHPPLGSVGDLVEGLRGGRGQRQRPQAHIGLEDVATLRQGEHRAHAAPEQRVRVAAAAAPGVDDHHQQE